MYCEVLLAGWRLAGQLRLATCELNRYILDCRFSVAPTFGMDERTVICVRVQWLACMSKLRSIDFFYTKHWSKLSGLNRYCARLGWGRDADLRVYKCWCKPAR